MILEGVLFFTWEAVSNFGTHCSPWVKHDVHPSTSINYATPLESVEGDILLVVGELLVSAVFQSSQFPREIYEHLHAQAVNPDLCLLELFQHSMPIMSIVMFRLTLWYLEVVLYNFNMYLLYLTAMK